MYFWKLLFRVSHCEKKSVSEFFLSLIEAYLMNQDKKMNLTASLLAFEEDVYNSSWESGSALNATWSV